MSTEVNYRPTGVMQGDSKAVPDRGTKTGVTDGYGGDLSEKALNKKGSFNADSDGMQEGGLSKNKR